MRACTRRAGAIFLSQSNRTLRRGVVLVSIIVLLTLCLTFFGIWTRQTLRDRDRIDTHQRRLQATRLAEAGVRRAMALRAADPAFTEQTWSVPADELDQMHMAEVRIKVTQADARVTKYEATAEYPVGTLRRVQITKKLELPNSDSPDES
jgi:Tfp pilus assembly protein PilX